MILLITATNRPDSNSAKVAANYAHQLTEKKVKFSTLSLEDIPQDLFNNKMYINNSHPGLVALQDTLLKPATKFIFIVPEYNGSFPGIFKAFIDACDIPACFYGKKACLVGVAAGRAGNLRGMDHLTNILNHIKIAILPMKIPISKVNEVLNAEGKITDTEIMTLLNGQIDEFVAF